MIPVCVLSTLFIVYLPHVFPITLIVFSNSSHLEPRLVCLVPSVFKSALFSCSLRVLCMLFSLCGTVFINPRVYPRYFCLSVSVLCYLSFLCVSPLVSLYVLSLFISFFAYCPWLPSFVC